VARGPRSRLLAELSSGVATRFSALDLASLPRWALTLPHVPWLWALPSREESFGAFTCSSASDLVSLSRSAPVLPRGTGLASPRGELRCYHVLHDFQRIVDHGNKEGPSCPITQLGSHVSKARSRVIEALVRRAARMLQFSSTVQHMPS
jgi:hypothetical protein